MQNKKDEKIIEIKKQTLIFDEKLVGFLPFDVTMSGKSCLKNSLQIKIIEILILS